MGLERLVGAITGMRKKRRLNHEQGHIELCYPGEIGGHFQLPPKIEEQPVKTNTVLVPNDLLTRTVPKESTNNTSM